MTGPLSGIRVVEMSHMVMGPACGMILAQLGAEVVKVEPPSGDKTRRLNGMGRSFFPVFNRGKRSVVLDLDTASGAAALARLLEGADIFIENFRDETIARRGLDPATLRRRYPRLIVGAHRGFLSGPYAHRPAMDEVVQMMTGLAYMTGSRDRPLRVGSSMNDIMGGMFGVIGILAALHERERTGVGTDLRVGLFENCLFAVAQHMVQYDLTGAPAPPMQQRVHAWPVYDLFDTADGQRLFVAMTTDGHWRSFCRAFDLAALLDDPAFATVNARVQARDRMIPMVAERLRARPAAEIEETLDRLAIPFSRINAPEEMFDDPHVARPGGLVTVVNDDGATMRMPVLPLEFGGRSLSGGLRVPPVGADTADVLADARS